MHDTQSSIHRFGRFPGRGNGNPSQYSYMGNLMDRGTWQSPVHGVTKVSFFGFLFIYFTLFGHDWSTKQQQSNITGFSGGSAVNDLATKRQPSNMIILSSLVQWSCFSIYFLLTFCVSFPVWDIWTRRTHYPLASSWILQIH